MQTIQLQVQDDIYEELKSRGIDINNKLQDFLYDLVDDGYSSISTNEAKQRVAKAVDRYKDGTGTYANADEYLERKSDMIESIKATSNNPVRS